MSVPPNQDDADRLLALFPESARPLLAASGVELVRRIGLDVVREVVVDVLSGVNLRDSTEMLTRRRLAMLNAAAIVMLIKGVATIPDLIQRLPDLATNRLQRRLPKADQWLLLWILGLTGKARQNVLRDSSDMAASYAERYREALEEASSRATEDWGMLDGILELDEVSTSFDWRFALQLTSLIGAQTLAIRGSEKSLYGKLFERLVLGSLLHALGFRLIEPADLKSSDECVFWLSHRAEKRESDATLLFQAGRGVRFDIGFIGKGNPEISLDKVSRFEREVEFGRSTWYLATFILVDTIPKNGRLEELAAAIEGTIIQMSMSFWPRIVASQLYDRIGYDSTLRTLPDRDISPFLQERMSKAPMDQILSFAAASPEVPVANDIIDIELNEE